MNYDFFSHKDPNDSTPAPTPEHEKKEALLGAEDEVERTEGQEMTYEQIIAPEMERKRDPVCEACEGKGDDGWDNTCKVCGGDGKDPAFCNDCLLGESVCGFNFNCPYGL